MKKVLSAISIIFCLNSSFSQTVVDSSFGIDGVAEFILSSYDEVKDMESGLGRHYVLALTQNFSLPDNNYSLICLDEMGTLDQTFADSGLIHADLTSVNMTSPFKLTLKDSCVFILGTGTTGANSGIVIIDKLNFDGTKDSTFGTNGSTSFSVHGVGERPFSMIIDDQDRIVVVGGSPEPLNQFDEAPFIARLTSDGSRDSTFGTSGVVRLNSFDQSTSNLKTTHVSGGRFQDLCQGTDGDYYCVGFMSDNSVYTSVIARFNEDGTLDNSLDSNGVLYPYLIPATSTAWKITELDPGRFAIIFEHGLFNKDFYLGILDGSTVTGYTYDFSGAVDRNLDMYKANGSVYLCGRSTDLANENILYYGDRISVLRVYLGSSYDQNPQWTDLVHIGVDTTQQVGGIALTVDASGDVVVAGRLQESDQSFRVGVWKFVESIINSMAEPELEKSTLIPNPNHGRFYITNFDGPWSIYDATGQIISTGEGQKVDEQLKPGIYILSGESGTFRFVVD